jgi:hypothetical protein
MTASIETLKALAEKATQHTDGWEPTGHGRVWQRNRKIGGVTNLVDVRGWGYLTGKGHGALGLDETAAIEIQSTIENYIAAANPQAILELIERAEKAESLLSAAMKSQRTKGCVEVCEECDSTVLDGQPEDKSPCTERDCPLQQEATP